MNSHMNDNELRERLIAAHSQVNIPDSHASWLKVKARLDKRARRMKWKRRINMSVAIICVALAINLFVIPDMAPAYSQFTKLIQRVKGDFIDIIFSSPEKEKADTSGAKTTAPPDTNDESSDYTDAEWENLMEIKNKAAFDLLIPSYIPDGYRLDLVRSPKEPDGRYKYVYLEYINSEGELLRLSQRAIDDMSADKKITKHKNSGDVFELIIGEYDAVMIKEAEGLISLMWLSETEEISLSGYLSESEIRTMAESM